MGKCNLLIGNGILRNFGYESWDKIIENRAKSSKYKKVLKKDKHIPANVRVILATEDKVNELAKDFSNKLKKFEMKEELKLYLNELLSIGFDDIFTTNYTYEIEFALKGRKVAYSTIRDTMQHFNNDNNWKYCLNTCNCVNGVRVWHIHGEARKPDSMIMGSYYYGHLLSYWENYLKVIGDSYQKNALVYANNDTNHYHMNFIDHFILEPMVIIGTSLDFYEMDLWWLLNRRKNEELFKNLKNRPEIIYYTPKEYGKESVYALLETYGITVKNLGIQIRPIIPYTEDDRKKDKDGTKEKDIMIKNSRNEQVNKKRYRKFYKAVLEDLKNNPMTKE